MQAVAFMPWVRAETSGALFGCRLRAYDRDDTAWPPSVRQVLQCYLHGGGNPVRCATLIEVDGEIVRDFDEPMRARVFQFCALLSFAALLRRRFFSNDYLNADTFQVVIEPCGDHVAVVSRRRDGRTTTVSSRDLYRVSCPNHVAAQHKYQPDEPLLRAVEAALDDESQAGVIDDAIFQLNLAESDSPRINETMQLMLLSGCIQRILGVHSKSAEGELANAFGALLSQNRTWKPKQTSDCQRSEVQHAFTGTLREAWYRDFYRTRNDYAHGRRVPGRKPFWSVEEHLLMASFVAPRLLMARLSEWGRYELTENDRRDFRAIDRLLCVPNLFGRRDGRWGEQWVWDDAFKVLTTDVLEDGTEEDTLWPTTDGGNELVGRFHYGPISDPE